MSQEAKQSILDFMLKKKGKTKYYFNELCKTVPDMKMRQAEKIINELVNEASRNIGPAVAPPCTNWPRLLN